jgi:hypothetical protein
LLESALRAGEKDVVECGGKGKSEGGTGAGNLFGLGVWEGEIYGFERVGGGKAPVPPALLSIDAQSGKATVLSSFNFANGWSGAGVTTKVSVTVPPPPR